MHYYNIFFSSILIKIYTLSLFSVANQRILQPALDKLRHIFG